MTSTAILNQRVVDDIIRKDREACIRAQAAADPVYRALGDGAPPSLYGESPLEYRQRLLRPLQPRCAQFKDMDLSVINDDATFSAFERVILSDALSSTRDPASFRPGEMRPIVTMDQAGRPVTRYIGHPGACWDRFTPPSRFARNGLESFNLPRNVRG